MAVKRIIPCLDVHGGKTVKGVNFVDLKEVGDAVELGRKYASEGADELVYLDISATVEERRTFTGLVERLTAAIDIPLTVGGGIASLDDVARLRDAGAARVSINSAAILTPQLIDDIAARYGSDAVVAAIDGKFAADGTWRVTTHGGTRISDKELFAWAREVEQRGAGQILFTSMEHDGTRKGYPIELFAQLADTVSIPVIASGGAGSVADIAEVLTSGRADAALAASIFHYGEIPIPVLKRELRALGIDVN
ncbi:MAG: imidazole glycerol phosphate synthase subunit HisF [Alistipes sp.]|jgi:cyclase|nr:imidazole glycerol phosphate synthase subunit HisF [Alistipes sp.]